jgi:hypothetical protein
VKWLIAFIVALLFIAVGAKSFGWTGFPLIVALFSSLVGAGLSWPVRTPRELHVPEVSRLVLYRQLQACKDELADLNEASKTFDEHRRVLDDNLADVRARLENVHAQLVHKDGGVYR